MTQNFAHMREKLLIFEFVLTSPEVLVMKDQGQGPFPEVVILPIKAEALLDIHRNPNIDEDLVVKNFFLIHIPSLAVRFYLQFYISCDALNKLFSFLSLT